MPKPKVQINAKVQIPKIWVLSFDIDLTLTEPHGGDKKCPQVLAESTVTCAG